MEGAASSPSPCWPWPPGLILSHFVVLFTTLNYPKALVGRFFEMRSLFLSWLFVGWNLAPGRPGALELLGHPFLLLGWLWGDVLPWTRSGGRSCICNFAPVPNGAPHGDRPCYSGLV